MHLGYKRFKLRKFLIKSLQDDGIQGRRLITTFIEQALVIVEPKNLTNARHPAILALPYSALEHFCPLKVIECDGVLRVPVFTFGFFVFLAVCFLLNFFFSSAVLPKASGWILLGGLGWWHAFLSFFLSFSLHSFFDNLPFIIKVKSLIASVKIDPAAQKEPTEIKCIFVHPRTLAGWGMAVRVTVKLITIQLWSCHDAAMGALFFTFF